MGSTIKVSREGFVTDRVTSADLGRVAKIGWPREVEDPSNGGRMVIEETAWEARRPHETLVVSHLGFPTFSTRREAVAHLAGGR